MTTARAAMSDDATTIRAAANRTIAAAYQRWVGGARISCRMIALRMLCGSRSMATSCIDGVRAGGGSSVGIAASASVACSVAPSVPTWWSNTLRTCVADVLIDRLLQVRQAAGPLVEAAGVEMLPNVLARRCCRDSTSSRSRCSSFEREPRLLGQRRAAAPACCFGCLRRLAASVVAARVAAALRRALLRLRLRRGAVAAAAAACGCSIALRASCRNCSTSSSRPRWPAGRLRGLLRLAARPLAAVAAFFRAGNLVDDARSRTRRPAR